MSFNTDCLKTCNYSPDVCVCITVSNLIENETGESKPFLLSATKLWIVIGCIIALVAVAVVQAGCTIYRTMRSPSPNNKVILIENFIYFRFRLFNIVLVSHFNISSFLFFTAWWNQRDDINLNQNHKSVG